MADTAFEIYQHTYQNAEATTPLRIPVLVIANTPDEVLEANVRVNGARDLPWLKLAPAHDRVAVIVGGGPSLADHVGALCEHAAAGHTLIAINAAASWLIDVAGIRPDYQLTCDAKAETRFLIERRVPAHLLASQCDPETVARAPNATLFHMIMEGIEDLLPPARVKRGGYALIGGGASSGNTAMAVAYTLGYRTLHVYGFDSSNRNGKTHAYPQPMNALIPNTLVSWAGQEFTSSLAMKAQAEKFVILGQRLQQMGCQVHVHGDGLLPTMWRTPAADLSEQEKYTRMWIEPSYRTHSPAEGLVDVLLATFPDPRGQILDLGCGPARAALRLTEAGRHVTCVDFAENARDKEAAGLPFLQWDLARPIPLRAPYGYCCDVMEHIPPAQVEDVLSNIAAAVTDTVVMRIEFEPDVFGEAVLGLPLHLSLHDADWWLAALQRHFADVSYEGNGIYICRRSE